MSGTLFLTGLVVGLMVVVALLVGGWGPAPIVAVAFLVLGAPGLFAGWLLYRRRVKAGEVPPLGAQARGEEGATPSPTRREAEAERPGGEPVR